jgi:hypothetical protein
MSPTATSRQADSADATLQGLRRLQQDLLALQEQIDPALVPARWATHRLGGLRVHTETIPDPAALRARLQELGGSGWVEASGAVHEIGRNQPLAARGWTLTTLEEADPEAADVRPVLLHRVEQASMRDRAEVLVYKVAQTLVDGTLQPLDAWFAGFARTARA